MRLLATVALAALLWLCGNCFAWYGHSVAVGPLSIFVAELSEVTTYNTPYSVAVTLTNTSAQPINGTIEVRDLVDETTVVGPARKSFAVPAKGSAEVKFSVAFGKGALSALYPVHVYATFEVEGKKLQAHAVRIVRTNFARADVAQAQPAQLEPIVVPERGALPLWTLEAHRVAWQFFGEPMRYHAAGWTGSDRQSRAVMQKLTASRGESRAAIGLHPPWKPRAGTIFCDYLLKLPKTKPLSFEAYLAIRDNTANEPPSDGVWFRVWVARGTAGENAKLVLQKFTASKRWVKATADLSPFAGQTVLLRLESHPGPKNDTTCDMSYWGEPTVVAGEPPRYVPLDLKRAGQKNVARGRELLVGSRAPDGRFEFLFGSGGGRVAAVFHPTERGIADGVLTLVGRTSAVSFAGFTVDILGQHALRWPTAVRFLGYEVRQEGERAVHIHRLELNGKPVELRLAVWPEGEGLRISFNSTARITDFALGPADRPAPVVYYGHGYRIVNPKAFRAHFGGHNLSTSHVGCEFAGGMSVLQAVDVPPDYFSVNPEAHDYSLHTHMNGTLTLVAGENGALDCAIRYRPLFDKKPAGGVARLAGRFCFDIWGGRYAEVARNMEEMIRYGLTDAILTKHVWQRWGYDYRLPDIWPPDPRLGTVEDLQRLGKICREHDILWGLHDNYIDFYPDATGYTYDYICFTRDGKPIKAWYNEARDAQSYRWRPDCFMPFLKRNLQLIKRTLAPTHYFIDVFTSIGCFDYYDRQGNFHPSTQTRRMWGEAFAWIRNYLGQNAPTTSEAGHDQLIGYLDGADCQFLLLSPTPGRFKIRIACHDWERVPWYDAVNHHRFILHGVGYSVRYQAGRSRSEHGINSDDYISAEILTGHALMTDAGSWGRQAVRKYWLAQDVARNLALRKILAVRFAEGNMHRQIVEWDNGTTVYVNRGRENWSIAGHVLPQYGYLVQGKGLLSAIELREGVICEQCLGPSGWYCNARTFDPERRLRIAPHIENFRYLGGRRFAWDVVWQAEEPAPRDMTVFVHFYKASPRGRQRIAFQDDHRPPQRTTAWRGTARYAREIAVPADADGEYTVGFGLYDSRGRLALSGKPVAGAGEGVVYVGTLRVRRAGDAVAAISFSPAPPPQLPRPRANLTRVPVDFGFALTDGAFRVQRTGSGLRLIPLPQSPPFAAALRLAQLGAGGKRVARVVAVQRDGTQKTAAFSQRGEELKLAHDGRAFCYEIIFR